ncbi:hypothetical protein CASFOL_005594 [Castilleja foliolosa]|uniref:NFD4 C-terminal domain-containing protein n=1 Tax=Castilleja foliolosa TaxID=1961234 RepID=A0ABD3E3X9_9LAMI
MLLNSILPLIVCVLAAPLARHVRGGKLRILDGGFWTLFVITVFTGFFGVITSLEFTRFLPPLFRVVGLLVLLLLPLVTALAEKVRETVQQKCILIVHDSNINEDISMDNECEDVSREEIGAMLMLRRLEFWLYFFSYLFGPTLGLVYLNNLGQIAESRGCLQTSSLVSLSSAFGFFGRLLPSLVFYFFSKYILFLILFYITSMEKWAVSTVAAMAAMMGPMCGAFCILFVSGHDIALYIATAIIHICTGAITTISVSTTTELFGAENFGVNHNIVDLNIPIGSFMFGNFSAFLYGKGVDGEEGNCMGHKCYQTTFMIWGFLCVLGTMLGLVLHSKTRKIVCTD